MTKVNFIYSWIYDEVFKELYNLKGVDDRVGQYPEDEEVCAYITEIEPIWDKEETKILDKLSEVTKLGWSDRQIDCYVVGYAMPISAPLTVPIFRNRLFYFIDILEHELIHVLLTQNKSILEKYWNELAKKYPDLSPGALNHILVHAILKKAFLELGYEEQLNNQREQQKFLDDYAISWKIVDEEGYQEIIDEMISFKGK